VARILAGNEKKFSGATKTTQRLRRSKYFYRAEKKGANLGHPIERLN